jgi:hypothetical protein
MPSIYARGINNLRVLSATNAQKAQRVNKMQLTTRAKHCIEAYYKYKNGGRLVKMNTAENEKQITEFLESMPQNELREDLRKEPNLGEKTLNNIMQWLNTAA